MENKIIVAVKGIIICNGKALIIKRSNYDDIGAGIWEFAGGKLEFGEDLKQALVREALEETGLPITVDKLLYATTFMTSKERQVVVMAYLCESQTDCVIISSEHDAFMWATIEELKTNVAKGILNDLEEFKVFEVLENLNK